MSVSTTILRSAMVGLLGAFALTSPGRPASWVTRHLGAEQGLPQSSVLALARTPEGDLWLGTEEGLARWDGLEIRVFDSGERGLPHDIVDALAVDRGGTLWIGTPRGLARRRLGLLPDRVEAVPAAGREAITTLAARRDGSIAIGTRQGVRLFAPSTGAGGSVGELRGFGGTAQALVEVDGTLWIGSAGGLFEVDGEAAGAVARPVRLPGEISGAVSALAAAEDGGLWVATERGLAHLARSGAFELLDLPVPLRESEVRALVPRPGGSLWIGSYGAGLFELRDGRIAAGPPVLYGSILNLLIDPEGSLWVGTDGGGLEQLLEARFDVMTRTDGLPGDEIRAVVETAAGAFWIGTDEGGVAIVADDRVVGIIGRRDGLPSDTVTSLWPDRRAGAVWIGTDRGLAVARRGRVRAVGADAGLPAEEITALGSDVAGRLLVGTASGLYREAGARFERAPAAWQVGGAPVRMIDVDRAGRLWLGTAGDGLRRIGGGAVAVRGPRQNWPGIVAALLEREERGEIWLGTDHGLCRLAASRLACFGRRAGIPSQLVFGLLDDRRSRLWLSTNRGLAAIRWSDLDDLAEGRRATVEPMRFGSADGLRTIEANAGAPAAIRARDGRLWIAMLRGLVSVDPSRLDREAPRPRALVRSLAVDDVEIDVASDRTIGPRPGKVEIHYTAPSFLDPPRLRFRRRLVGLEEAWSAPTGERSVVYGRLPPGRYRFEVMVDGGRLRIGERGGTSGIGSVGLVVRPAPWERPETLGLAILGIAASGAAIARFRGRRRLAAAARRERELEIQVAARTADLAAANAELERLSREDALTGLANRRAFDDALARELARGARAGAPVSLLLLDVDRFKAYNDALGHPAGDDCLRRIARVLAGATARAGDLAARYGGEELAAILPGTSLEGALALAETVRREIESLDLQHPGSPLGRVSASLGVAAAAGDGASTPAALLAAADAALYRAKELGRNRVEATDPASVPREPGPTSCEV